MTCRVALAALVCTLAWEPGLAVPLTMPTSGVLRDQADNLAPDGEYSAVFGLYAAENEGEALWTESRTIEVSGGSFHAKLGSVKPIEPALFADGKSRWLEIAVEGDPPLPRWPVGSTAYAFHAASAAKLGCTGCIELAMLSPEALDAVKTLTVTAVTGAGFVKSAELSDYARKDDLATVATTGAYADLKGTPDLTPYAKEAELAKVAGTGDYDDLSNKPDLGAVDAAKLGGYPPNQDGQAAEGTIPVTGPDGTIPEALLPPGGLAGTDLNIDLLSSSFKTEACADGLPATAPTDFGEVSAELVLSESGTMKSAVVTVVVVHSSPDALKLKLTRGGFGDFAAFGDSGGTGSWTVDVVDHYGDVTPQGSWTLGVQDANGSDGLVTIQSFCVEAHYVSDHLIEVKGDLTVSGRRDAIRVCPIGEGSCLGRFIGFQEAEGSKHAHKLRYVDDDRFQLKSVRLYDINCTGGYVEEETSSYGFSYFASPDCAGSEYAKLDGNNSGPPYRPEGGQHFVCVKSLGAITFGYQSYRNRFTKTCKNSGGAEVKASWGVLAPTYSAGSGKVAWELR